MLELVIKRIHMRTIEHFYKGYAIYNMQKTLGIERRVFYIFPDCGRRPEDGAIEMVATLQMAHQLIDLWTSQKNCACGARRASHHHQCIVCRRHRCEGLVPPLPVDCVLDVPRKKGRSR